MVFAFHLRLALDRIAALEADIAALRATLERLAEQTTTATVLPFPGRTLDPHRAAHRPGVASRIARDPELRAFVELRLDHMPFAAIADATRVPFGPARGVGRTAVHEWWKKRHTAAK